MVFLVPFDGSPAAAAALDRAVEHGEALGSEVVAVSVVPTGTEFARRRIWIDPGEDFALETGRQELERKIDETTDDTDLHYDGATAGSPDDGIANEVRQVARDVDATVLFVGASDAAGRTAGVSLRRPVPFRPMPSTTFTWFGPGERVSEQKRHHWEGPKALTSLALGF